MSTGVSINTPSLYLGMILGIRSTIISEGLGKGTGILESFQAIYLNI